MTLRKAQARAAPVSDHALSACLTTSLAIVANIATHRVGRWQATRAHNSRAHSANMSAAWRILLTAARTQIAHNFPARGILPRRRAYVLPPRRAASHLRLARRAAQ